MSTTLKLYPSECPADVLKISVPIPSPAPTITNIKSGIVVAASFAGNPKTTSVVFGTAFPDANYTVTVDEDATTNSYAPRIENKTATGFDINLNSNSLTGLTAIMWQAMPVGE